MPGHACLLGLASLASVLLAANGQVTSSAAGAQAIALVPRDLLEGFRPRVGPGWRLVALEEATAEDVAAAVVLSPSFSLIRNSSAFVDVMKDMKSGKLLQWMFTGYDALNMSEVPSHFAVCDVHQGGVSIPEYVIAAVLSWNVRLPQMDAEFRRCSWHGHNDCSPQRPHKAAHGQTLGVVGLGTIGRGVAERAAALGMRVIAVEHRVPSSLPPYMAWVGGDEKLPQLMGESDFVVLAVPLLPGTRGLVGSEALRHMKPEGVLVNIARGPVVDETALFEALESKRIGGAVLDVWWNENSWQSGSMSPSQYNFSALPNVWMTPHASSQTQEAANESLDQAVENFAALLDGRPLSNVVRNSSLAELANAAFI